MPKTIREYRKGLVMEISASCIHLAIDHNPVAASPIITIHSPAMCGDSHILPPSITINTPPAIMTEKAPNADNAGTEMSGGAMRTLKSRNARPNAEMSAKIK